MGWKISNGHTGDMRAGRCVRLAGGWGRAFLSNSCFEPLPVCLTVMTRVFSVPTPSRRFFLMRFLYTPCGCHETTARATRLTRPPRASNLADENRQRLPYFATNSGRMNAMICAIQLLRDKGRAVRGVGNSK